MNRRHALFPLVVLVGVQLFVVGAGVTYSLRVRPQHTCPTLEPQAEYTPVQALDPGPRTGVLVVLQRDPKGFWWLGEVGDGTASAQDLETCKGHQVWLIRPEDE